MFSLRKFWKLKRLFKSSHVSVFYKLLDGFELKHIQINLNKELEKHVFSQTLNIF